MRRRRSALQVTTFPFLAVLLCAMGSLILLLLVMDRRAKIVARNRAQEAAQKAAQAAATTRAEQLAAQQAEWERRRQQLRQGLQEEDQQLKTELAAARGKNDAAAANLTKLQGQLTELQQKLTQEQAQFRKEEADLNARLSGLTQATHHEKDKRSQLLRLAAELTSMEQTLAELKKVKQQNQQTYSLVPYSGKRGDSRKPLYLECTAAGLILHPQRQLLAGSFLTGSGLRSHLEKCLGPLPSSEPKHGERWSSNAAAPAEPRLDPAIQKIDAYLMFLVRPEGIENFYQAQQALRTLPVDYGYEFIDADWKLDFATDQLAHTEPWRTTGSATVAAPLGPHSPTGNKVTGIRLHSPLPQERGPGFSGGSPGGPPDRPTSPPFTAHPGGRPLLNDGVSDSGQRLAVPKPQGSGLAMPSQADPPAPLAFAGQRPTSHAPPSEEKQKVGKVQETIDRPDEAQPDKKPKLPEQDRFGSQQAPPAVLVDRDRVQRPPPLGKIIGNRDFPIVINCTAQGVNLMPGGAIFSEEDLRLQKPGEHHLVQAVRQLIYRRQGSLRPGEPPYRPLLRFQIHPDGLRTYYLAYPLLERLRLPMTRENLE